MLDAIARKMIDPPLDRLGKVMASRGISADAISLAGLGAGLLAALAVAGGLFWLAAVLIVVSRTLDGLDGATARATTATDFGGYLDIAVDFLFYGSIPLAFALYNPDANAVAAAALLTAFYFNGASFLGFAVIAAKRGLETRTSGVKSIYFSNGLLEGTETILFFLALCIWPQNFVPMAYVFGGLCMVTAIVRLFGARRLFA